MSSVDACGMNKQSNRLLFAPTTVCTRSPCAFPFSCVIWTSSHAGACRDLPIKRSATAGRGRPSGTGPGGPHANSHRLPASIPRRQLGTILVELTGQCLKKKKEREREKRKQPIEQANKCYFCLYNTLLICLNFLFNQVLRS